PWSERDRSSRGPGRPAGAREALRARPAEYLGSGAGERPGHVPRPLEMVGSHADADFEHIQAAAALEAGKLSDVGLEFVARTGLRLKAFTRAATVRIRFLPT